MRARTRESAGVECPSSNSRALSEVIGLMQRLRIEKGERLGRMFEGFRIESLVLASERRQRRGGGDEPLAFNHSFRFLRRTSNGDFNFQRTLQCYLTREAHSEATNTLPSALFLHALACSSHAGGFLILTRQR